MSHYYWLENKTLLLKLRIIPGSQKNNFAGIKDGILRIKLNAQPRDNEANIALIYFLAKAFNISKSQVTIVSGFKSRSKQVSLVNPKTFPMEAEVLLS